MRQKTKIEHNSTMAKIKVKYAVVMELEGAMDTWTQVNYP